MIRVHTTKVNALHLPVKGLMDMLGLDTEKLLDTKKVPGVSVDKDDLILDPQYILPPPQLQGHLTSIKIVNKRNRADVRRYRREGQRPRANQ